MCSKNKRWLPQTDPIQTPHQSTPSSCALSSNQIACFDFFRFFFKNVFVSCFKQIKLLWTINFIVNLVFFKLAGGYSDKTNPLCLLVTDHSAKFSRIVLPQIRLNEIYRLNVSQECDQNRFLRTLLIKRNDQQVFFFQDVVPEFTRYFLLPNTSNVYGELFKVNLQAMIHMPTSNTPLLRVVLTAGGLPDTKTKLVLFKEENHWFDPKRTVNLTKFGTTFVLTRNSYFTLDIPLAEFKTPHFKPSYSKYVHLSVAPTNDQGDPQPLNIDFKMTNIAIACAEIRDKKIVLESCRVQMLNDQVVCMCQPLGEVKNMMLVGYFAFCMLLFWSYIALIIWQDHTDQVNANQVGSEQVFWVLCSPKTVQFRYELCFRIGCASWNFDFNNTSIDFELLAPENRLMTQGRINTSLLQKEKINEVLFIMNRLTPLTYSSLDSISFKHNGVASSKIYFYGIFITEYETRVQHYFPVNVYVRSFWLKVSLCPSTDPIEMQLHNIEANGQISPSVSMSSISTSTSNYNVRSVRNQETLNCPVLDLNSNEMMFLYFFGFAMVNWLLLSAFTAMNAQSVSIMFGYLYGSISLTGILLIIISVVFRLVVKYQAMRHYFLHRQTLMRHCPSIGKFVLFTIANSLMVTLMVQQLHIELILTAYVLMLSLNATLVLFGLWEVFRRLWLLDYYVCRDEMNVSAVGRSESDIMSSASRGMDDEQNEIKTTAM